MGKRRWSILFCGLLALLLCACGLVVLLHNARGDGLPAEGSWITGRYLSGKDSDLIVNGEWNVISMGAADETVSFENFEDGDAIRVYIDYILETWPGQTMVYAVEKAEDEEIQEISPKLMEELREMGWIE